MVDLCGVPDEDRSCRKSNINKIRLFCVACKKATCPRHSTVNINRKLVGFLLKSKPCKQHFAGEHPCRKVILIKV